LLCLGHRVGECCSCQAIRFVPSKHLSGGVYLPAPSTGSVRKPRD
jgi:hypothetical protein